MHDVLEMTFYIVGTDPLKERSGTLVHYFVFIYYNAGYSSTTDVIRWLIFPIIENFLIMLPDLTSYQ